MVKLLFRDESTLLWLVHPAFLMGAMALWHKGLTENSAFLAFAVAMTYGFFAFLWMHIGAIRDIRRDYVRKLRRKNHNKKQH